MQDEEVGRPRLGSCQFHLGVETTSVGESTPSRIRTRGLLIRSQALYPLSYGGVQQNQPLQVVSAGILPRYG
jgi:hypothetical protein